jgi:hypothetical protein
MGYSCRTFREEYLPRHGVSCDGNPSLEPKPPWGFPRTPSFLLFGRGSRFGKPPTDPPLIVRAAISPQLARHITRHKSSDNVRKQTGH